ncbi:hypothetical protein FRB96_009433 [Tulasnella sp. 330]|nr:hypothetical protein FRB96_009433 [Tulasnella sp. 330]KAG8870905.1 hypothetical protein FRB97_009264 [Tulasnella sp. 331]
MDSRKTPRVVVDDSENILAQIARLTAKLPSHLKDAVVVKERPSKRKELQESIDRSNVLVTGSPSPKKRRIEYSHEAIRDTASAKPKQKPFGALNASIKPVVKPGFTPAVPCPSAALSTNLYLPTDCGNPSSSSSRAQTSTIPRAFAELDNQETSSRTASAVGRDDCMAVVENLQIGPVEHDPPSTDPNFEKLEPNSHINLLSRKMPHDDLQDVLRGRYHLSPSMLYSVVRLSKNRLGYDVPVEGEWVTIAVVAQRGNVQVSRGFGGNKTAEDGEDQFEDDDSGAEQDSGPSSSTWKSKLKTKSGPKKPAPTGKKYVSIKLVDFGHKPGSKGSGSASGDAMLTLLLFEADMVSKDQEKARGSTRYKGGSGGAFEELLPKLREGAVVAILNPRVLKPYLGKNATGGPNSKPHPMSNILGISPNRPDAIHVIGYSKDLGMCSVKTKEGRVCGSWCDKRRAEVCEYHLLSAVKSKRAGRAEFSAGTGGMSVGGPSMNVRNLPFNKRRGASSGTGDFDPTQKWGLLPSATSSSGRPRNEGAGITYVMTGGTLINSARDTLHITQQAQKERDEKQHRAKEKKEKKDEGLLKELLRRDAGGVGGQAIAKAKEYAKEMMRKREREKRLGVNPNAKGKGKGEERNIVSEKRKRMLEEERELDEDEKEEAEDAERREKLRKGVYRPEMLKRIGFDPTLKPGDGRQAKSGAAASVFNLGSREIHLSPRRGTKIRSGVIVPKDKQFHRIDKPTTLSGHGDIDNDGGNDLRNLEDEDDELPSLGEVKVPALSIKELRQSRRSLVPTNASEQTDSDSELEIEAPG